MSLERRGIPTATFVTDAFATYAQGLCRMQKMAALPIIVIAHPIVGHSTEELREKVRLAHVDLRPALLQAE